MQCRNFIKHIKHYISIFHFKDSAINSTLIPIISIATHNKTSFIYEVYLPIMYKILERDWKYIDQSHNSHSGSTCVINTFKLFW